MTTPPPSNPNPTPAAAAPTETAPSGEHHFQKFWEKNARTIYLICSIVLLVIVARGAYDWYVRSKDANVGKEFAAASTPEKLKAFAAKNSGHVLAAVAKLQIADNSYQTGNYAQAVADYQAAADALKGNVLVGRARLGVASAKMRAGQTADAESQLNLIANDASLLKTVRAEAAYQLASSAAAAGRTDDAHKFLEQLTKIEPSGVWAQRGMMLRFTLPAPSAPLAAPSASTTAKP
ncbi:MAG: hypothetical protein QM790_14065 [Nibricoccus sp.]